MSQVALVWLNGANAFFSSEEDYRWAIVRAKIPAWMFSVLNLTFIGLSSLLQGCYLKMFTLFKSYRPERLAVYVERSYLRYMSTLPA
jgi:hypothetical protein